MDDLNKKNAEKAEKRGFPGYPHYPKSQDLYNKAREEGDVDPEDPTRKKPVETPGVKNEKDFVEDVSGADLDVPGAEIDDAQEEVGSEDEENNYYSLGGDNHESQEEQTGDKL